MRRVFFKKIIQFKRHEITECKWKTANATWENLMLGQQFAVYKAALIIVHSAIEQKDVLSKYITPN